MRPRRIVLVHDPIPSDLYGYVPCRDPMYHNWHVRVLYDILIELSKLHLSGVRDSDALAIVYGDVVNIEFLSSPEQTAYLRMCYGPNVAHVIVGLLNIAADYLGYEKVSLSVIHPTIKTTEEIEAIPHDAGLVIEEKWRVKDAG